jgi:TIR domain/SIR2-like domain
MSSQAEAGTEFFWEQLLQYIEGGRVVPVVGQELLWLPFASGEVQLYPYLAKRLAGKLGVSSEGLSALSALHEVACRHLDRRDDVEEVYSALMSVLPGPGELPIPEPLRKLAAIEPFHLFITTTFDPLLKRAIDEVRFAREARTEVRAYSTADPQDLPPDVDKLERPVVYHLFGRICPFPNYYAVTEEDMLEFIHSLQSKTMPLNLFHALTDRDLLVLGASFPSWLARFFLRVAKRERLLLNRTRDVVADSMVSSDPDLVLFLQRFSSRTRVFRGGAVEFIAELERRWRQRHPTGFVAPKPERREKPAAEMEDGAIFLCYASEDREVAQAVKVQLEDAGLDVWMDQEDLEPGDPYEEVIKHAIERCSAFVPLLSPRVLTPKPRFFRLEWDHAEKVAVRVPRTRHFIVPVALDGISSMDERLPERFRETHWALMEGKCPEAVVKVLTEAYRNYQLAQGGMS